MCDKIDDTKKHKAIGLFSGGLDSILAAKLIEEQGFEVILFHFTSPFTNEFSRRGSRQPGRESQVLKAAEELGMKLHIFRAKQDYYDMVRNPIFGYGRNVNPCIDCRIHILIKAREYMREVGADFIFTGEVLNQRPMSQHRSAMRQAEKASGLLGYLLRPLSAKRIDETEVEKSGLIDREKLEGIEGRGRKSQQELAEKFGIQIKTQAAGGCLLTDVNYTKRVHDLFKHTDAPGENEYMLLSLGRHFRLADGQKIVVARDNGENPRLEKLAGEKDVLFEPDNFPGPVALLRGDYDDEVLQYVARFIVSHSRARGEELQIRVTFADKSVKTIPAGEPVERRELDKIRIG